MVVVVVVVVVVIVVMSVFTIVLGGGGGLMHVGMYPAYGHLPSGVYNNDTGLIITRTDSLYEHPSISSFKQAKH